MAGEVGPARCRAWEASGIRYDELVEDPKELERVWARRTLAASRAK